MQPTGTAAIAVPRPYLDWNRAYFAMSLRLTTALLLARNVNLPYGQQKIAAPGAETR